MSMNCSACDDIRATDPNFVINGLGDSEIASLKNNTGLSPSSPNDDCTDLNNINDCLVGVLAKEVDSQSDCDWKPFTKTALKNVWTTIKSVIAAICGLWTNIANLWTLANKLECMIDYLSKGHTFKLGEVYADNTKSHIVAGKGVSFLNVSSSGTASDISVIYISGGLARLSGSCLFYNANFTDGASCYNFDDNGLGDHKSQNRSGNANWVGTNQKPGGAGSELVYELRIKKSEYPEISRFFSGVGTNAEGGGYHTLIQRYAAGTYADGQHGNCDSTNGNPTKSGYDRGHLVPNGWEYLQLRITWIESMSADANGAQYTPNALLGIRMNLDEIPC